ncbi:RHS repeat domain-containing protein [Flavobacterium sp. B17]|uniref:RHS repeat domain-containing protein n=1 Tax=Flavobacterium sp. B17 TaxID=95618 RepID=UPI00034C6F6E|nr:RHS repeat-associated core domain-containing protein [Flavobacterium sp. B17]
MGLISLEIRNIYNYVDLLGNVRLSYFNNGSSIEVLGENNYYPFGLRHEGYNDFDGNPSYQYKYNGKELQTETGMYDYGARFYMPDLGRWGVVDPLGEKMTRHSPYNYAFNNPLRFIDPDGRSNQDIIKVNSEGFVQEIIPQEGPHVVQDMEGNQLTVNDSGFDQDQLQAVIDMANTMSPIDLQYDGLRLFTPYSAKDMSDNFNKIDLGGIKSNLLNLSYISSIYCSLCNISAASYYMLYLGHSQLDFANTMTSLVSEGGNYPAPNPPGGFAKDGTGGFISFEGTNSLYNIYDAGNFITGKALQMLGFSESEVLKGADLNSKITQQGPDTAADQRALKNGYNYNRVQWKK